MRAHVEALQRQRERDEGRFDGQPVDPILNPVASTAAPGSLNVVTFYREHAPSKAETPSLEGLVDRYLTDNRALSVEWQRTLRAILDLFTSFVGPAIPARNVTKAQIRDWKEALHRFPSRGTLRDPGSDFKEIVRKNEIDKTTFNLNADY
jgi:hypothetical protein